MLMRCLLQIVDLFPDGYENKAHVSRESRSISHYSLI